MAPNPIKLALDSVLHRLSIFEREPKEIVDEILGEWFTVGELVFQAFYQLGLASDWKGSVIKSNPELKEIVNSVTKNQTWLQSFVAIYGATQVDLEGGVPAGDICRVRSGIAFLCEEFVGVSTEFNKVLISLSDSGELEEFDNFLRVWRDDGFRLAFLPGELKPTTPSAHWWWY